MTTNKAVPVITIDGPSGSGKETVSLLLAQKLGWHFLDSGCLYRVLALAASQQQISLENVEELTDLASRLKVEFKATGVGEPSKILLDNQDVSEAIRSEQCGNDASKLAVYASVRSALVEQQRAFRKNPGLVTDGRDMGSVIFPDALVKIFLMASMEERANRRYKQLKEQGKNVTFEKLLEEMAERDVRDQERAIAPLKPAQDAICIDTTGLSIDNVLMRVIEEISNFG